MEENGAVRFDHITGQLQDFFDPFDHAVPHLRILTQENADRMEKAFNRLPIESNVQNFGQIVGVDKFINARPGTLS